MPAKDLETLAVRFPRKGKYVALCTAAAHKLGLTPSQWARTVLVKSAAATMGQSVAPPVLTMGPAKGVSRKRGAE